MPGSESITFGLVALGLLNFTFLISEVQYTDEDFQGEFLGYFIDKYL